MVVDYNNSLDDLYIKTMKDLSYSFEEKRIISSVLLGIAHYMGIEFFFTKNIKDKGEFLKEMKGYFANGLRE